MKVAGSHTVQAPRQQVYDALQDPAVLARTLPGCQQLEVTDDDTYRATVTAGVASVKGTYAGTVVLLDRTEPSSYRMQASGAGAPGTISADATIRLEEDGEGTVVHYEADAIVGGMIGGVGQRMLQGVARRTAGEFFGNVERELTGAPVMPADQVGTEQEAEPGAAPTQARPSPGTVFAGARSGGGGAGADRTELLVAALVGAAIALLGVLVGRRGRS